jgi:hypothetical protein
VGLESVHDSHLSQEKRCPMLHSSIILGVVYLLPARIGDNVGYAPACLCNNNANAKEESTQAAASAQRSAEQRVAL